MEKTISQVQQEAFELRNKIQKLVNDFCESNEGCGIEIKLEELLARMQPNRIRHFSVNAKAILNL